MGYSIDELYYPHEFILYTIEKAKKSLKDTESSNQVYSFAKLLLCITEDQDYCILKDKENKIIEETKVFLNKNKASRKKLIFSYRKRINLFIEDYSKFPTKQTVKDLEEYIYDLLFFEILFNKLDNKSIFTKDIIKKIEMINNLDSKIDDIITILRIIKNKKLELNNLTEIKNILENKISNHDFTIYFSLLFSKIFSKYKSDFLFIHYKLIKLSLTKNHKMFEGDNIIDYNLVGLFKLAIILFLCDYNKSLRLNLEESLNYTEELISKPINSILFEKSYLSANDIRIKKLKIPFRNWIFPIIAGIFLFVSLFYDYNITASIDFLVELELPFELELFKTLAFLLTIVTIYRLLILKKEIVKNMDKGGNNELKD